jgi:hypothetical protein
MAQTEEPHPPAGGGPVVPRKSTRRACKKQVYNATKDGAKRTTHHMVTWEEKVLALKSYKKEHGDLLVTIRASDPLSGLALGSWVRLIRSGEIQLKDSETKELKLMGFLWNRSAASAAGKEKKKNKSWEVNVAALRKYQESHGNSNVTTRYVDEDGTKLGVWVKRLREGRINTTKEELK